VTPSMLIGAAGVLVIAPFAAVFTVAWRSFSPARETPEGPPPPTAHARDAVTFDSDGRRLRGWLTRPRSSAGCVLIVHGWGSHAQPLLQWAEFLADGGWASLVFDARGHGESEGSGPMTLDDVAEDVVSAGAFLDRNPETAALPRAVLGHSMGAAAVLLAVSRGLRAEAILLVSAFARVETLVARVLKKRGLPPGAFGWVVSWVWRLRARDLEAVEPHTNLPAVKVPTFLVHGTRDEVIPDREVQRLAAAWFRQPTRTLEGSGALRKPGIVRIPSAVRPPLWVLRVEGAGHSDLGDFPAFREGILEFLASPGGWEIAPDLESGP